MPRKLIGGLIQAAAPITDPFAPIIKVVKAAINAHIPLEEPGRKGVPILGLQEVFNGPYFCPSQDAHWYDIAEAVPGPTTELMAQYAKKYQMANTAAVYDNDGTYFCDGSSSFVDPRGDIIAMGSEDKDELFVAEMDLDMIEGVRCVWQFYRDRRPESYGSMAEQLP
jgi:N-carbamoylputrescine amidase